MNVIKNYNYIPNKFNFNSMENEKSNLYMGIELEVDKGGENDDNASKVQDLLQNDVYTKHDGSLSDGFEIVTHPSTLNYHKHMNYKEAFKFLTDIGYRSHDTSTCGMHVHVNRTFFGDSRLEQELNISNLLYLFEKFWDKIELIARRRSCRYAKRFTIEENDTPIDIYAKSKSADKYGAINLQHKDTVEIRIFKGTLNYETFMCTLEFVDLICRIAKECDIYNIQMETWDKVQREFSEELNKYYKERVEKGIPNSLAQPITRDYNLSNEWTVTRNPYIRGGRGNANLSYYEEYQNLMNRFILDRQDLSRQRSSFELEYDQLYMTSSEQNIPRERTRSEQIHDEINELETRVRRSQNGLETIHLNRRINELRLEDRRIRLTNSN